MPPARSAYPNESLGPQGSYDAHGWWAEQRAARAERSDDDPSVDVDPPTDTNGATPAGRPDDEAMAAAEEQSW